jgi:hypothetical protein
VAFAGPETDEGLSRGSVRVYRSYELNGRELEELLGVAADVLPRLLEYGEERFLALCGTLRATYAPDWRRP